MFRMTLNPSKLPQHKRGNSFPLEVIPFSLDVSNTHSLSTSFSLLAHSDPPDAVCAYQILLRRFGNDSYPGSLDLGLEGR